jgi:hypothetical protein
MIVAIHQPTHLPWCGYFYKAANCDIFVILDNVQLMRGRGYGTRCQIKTKDGPKWLTVPIKRRGEFQLIKDVEIENSVNWRKSHWETIRHSYAKSPFFVAYGKLFEKIYVQDWVRLADLNIALIKIIMGILALDTPLVYASDLGVEGTSTELLVNICRRLKGDAYLSGFGGVKYQDVQMFKAAEINLGYSNFIHPEYGQQWGDFIPGLSVIDLIFNRGPDALRMIKGGTA